MSHPSYTDGYSQGLGSNISWLVSRIRDWKTHDDWQTGNYFFQIFPQTEDTTTLIFRRTINRHSFSFQKEVLSDPSYSQTQPAFVHNLFL